ncbi:hypothetical protein V8E52_008686 [Russula decolorans]
MSYMFSYYGLAAAALNYLIIGLSYNVDGFYEHSFEIWPPLRRSVPRTASFSSGGLSVHLSQALLAHLFSYNITWGATKKEVERSNFFIEVPRILRRF